MEPQAATQRSDGLSWSFSFPARGARPAWRWVHFDLVHAGAAQAVAGACELGEFARQTLLGTDETPRLVSDGTDVAGVLPAYGRTGDADAYDTTCWHFAMTPGWLVTGRRRPTRTLFALWEAVSRGLAPDGPVGLLDLSIAELAREIRARVAMLSRELDPVEDRLIEPGPGGELDDMGRRLGGARREAVRLVRVLSPLHRALEEAEEELPDWARFDDGHGGGRLLRSALDDITALHDRCRSLQDELTTRLAEETNRRLYLVSVVTTLALPATFVTGLFGMNTGGLWWGGEAVPHGTLYATGMCVAAVVAALGLLRWRRLL